MMPPEDFQVLFQKYLSQLKPLVSKYEAREESFVAPLLTRLPHFFDIIAVYSIETDFDKKRDLLNQADKILDEVILCLKEANNDSILAKVDKFKSRYSENDLLIIDKGRFVGDFVKLDKEARNLVDKNDIITAYTILSDMEERINNINYDLIPYKCISDGKFTTWIKWGFSFVLGVLITFISAKYI